MFTTEMHKKQFVRFYLFLELKTFGLLVLNCIREGPAYESKAQTLATKTYPLFATIASSAWLFKSSELPNSVR